MKPQDIDIEKLVEEFSVNPGAEGERLEFKSKDILDSTKGKKKVVRTLSAMANQSGGTIIIGVRRTTDGDILYQEFDKDSEFKQDLIHIAQDYTNPPLQELWDINFEPCLGHLLLRIDISPAEIDLIKFEYDGEYQPWIRDGDGMREMTSAEIAEFYSQTSKREPILDSIEYSDHIALDPPKVKFDYPERQFPNRAVMEVDDRYTVVFGFGVLTDWIGKSVSYDLRTGFPQRGSYEQIPEMLDKASKIIEADIDRNLGYSIRVAEKQLIGRSARELKRDISRLDYIEDELRSISDGGWIYEPVIFGYASTVYGTLWFELQREAEHFTRGHLGIRLKDIPFDDEKLKRFFEEIGTVPHSYSHQQGLRYITLRSKGTHSLRNPDITFFTSEDDPVPLYIMCDNPFWDWDIIEESLETTNPTWFSDKISSHPRMPIQITGGYNPKGKNEFELNQIHYTEINGIHPTLLIDALCRQKYPNE